MCEDKRKIIAYLWYLNAVLSVCYVVVAIAAAAQQKDLQTAETNHAAGFAAVWSMAMLLAIIVGGTLTMKKFKTPIATGVFLGACIMYSQMELLLFAIFVGLGQNAVSVSERNSNNAMAVFSFFLFVLYSIFSACLFMFRHFVIDDSPSASENNYA